MAATLASRKLRNALRARMFTLRLGIDHKLAAMAMGFDRQQMWRFVAGEDVYTFDRLVDAAVKLGRTRRIRGAGARARLAASTGNEPFSLRPSSGSRSPRARANSRVAMFEPVWPIFGAIQWAALSITQRSRHTDAMHSITASLCASPPDWAARWWC